MKSILGRVKLRVLPKRTLTEWVGHAARKRWSRHLIPWYIRHYQIDCSEAEHAPEQYRCLVDFFARGLRADARPIAESGVVSPVDGTVSEMGDIQSGTLLQAKGKTYSLRALVGGEDLADAFQAGSYITIYLSPRDYHRIHAPLDGRVTYWRYIPGNLYPVNAAGVAHIQGLFVQNERLITQLATDFGTLALVKVGATIVGSIRTPYGPQYERPMRRKQRCMQSQHVSLPVQRGRELGRFEFGSTVILLFPPGMVDQFTVRTGDIVRMGQQIAILAGER
ncbi:phosphatidylserine decarboxylase proenzyme [Alicyclobacillus contaminans]|uniref:archaetidylserine decarboxylase n=1 Tax=Alicyclobacillus contaminans TaxID=392016 RepID=UPI00040169AF|nr:archaetidylserine decarboxylase [Alicyclobacillus contaminans]GMA49099.1 phosphatidylserine decarboxylase proenzyme [Alicyclobacillus contaminans]